MDPAACVRERAIERESVCVREREPGREKERERERQRCEATAPHLRILLSLVRLLKAMKGVRSWFADELGLSERFTAHSGTARAQISIVQPVGARLSRAHAQRSVAANTQRSQRLAILATYDLTADPRKFAVEQIFRRSLDDCNKDLSTLSAEDASILHTEDTTYTVNLLDWQQVITWRIPSSARRGILRHGTVGIGVRWWQSGLIRCARTVR